MILSQLLLVYIGCGIITFLLDEYKISVSVYDAETNEEIKDFNFGSVIIYLVAFTQYIILWPVNALDLILENFF